MCGRFSLTANIEELNSHFQVKNHIFMKPRYNIAPQETVPVLKKMDELDFLRWGYVPSFLSKNPKERGYINIRAESVAQKPSFRHNFIKGRCIIPADGYYEWKSIGRSKQPYYIRRKDKTVFGFAALWEGDTFGILTVPANSLLSPVHERMPVILQASAYAEWMNHKTPIEMLEKLLLPIQSESLEIYPVSPKMNRVGFEGPLCMQSLSSS